MGFLTFLPTSTDPNNKPMPSISSSSSSDVKTRTRTKTPPTTNNNKQKQPHKMENQPAATSLKTSSWDQFKNLLSCKQTDHLPRVHDPSKKPGGRSSCRSICSFRDVVHGNTRVVHRADNSPESSSLGLDEARSLTRKPAHGSSSRSLASSLSGTTPSSSTTSSRGRQQLRKLSGCYECHMTLDPSRYPITPRSTMCPCPQCGEIFPKIESLEHHQAIRHAVSDLGPEDSGRNIVEIIFKSSWMKKENPICKIERILKVHNTPRTIQRFEECRDAVKIRANAKKNARCAADGNELLRFHCSSLACALGSRGSSTLCADFPACGVCTIIRHGFQGSKGVRTTASSGRAHDLLDCSDGRRAMLVCRVIAGRIRRTPPNSDPTTTTTIEDEHLSTTPAACSYDSVTSSAGIYSNLEDLTVFNPRAILPCFVVIYKTLNIT